VRRRKRWLFGILLALIVVLMGGFFLLRPLQQHAAGIVLGQLEAAYGGRVTVGQVRVGLNGTTLRQVELWEMTEPGEPPSRWAIFDRVHLRIPPWRAWGESPHIDHIDIDGFQANIRLSDRGQLLLRLPPLTDADIPADRISVRNAEIQVEIDQSSDPPLAARDISAEIRRLDDDFRIAGTVGELLETTWNFGGQLRPSPWNLVLQVSCERLAIDLPGVRQLPLLSRHLPLDELAMRGEAVLSIESQLEWSRDSEPRFSANVAIESDELEFPQYGVAVHELTGRIRGERREWRLETLNATVLDAPLWIRGGLDLEQSPPVLDLDGEIQQLELAQLHAVGETFVENFPVEFFGMAQGTFSLELVLGQTVTVAGSSEARVVEAGWRDVPARQVELAGQLNHWQYDLESSTASVPDGTITLQLASEEIPLESAMRHLPPDLRTRLELQGRGSAELSVIIPLASFDDPATFQADGSFRGSPLVWETLHWTEVAGTWTLRDGLIALTELEADGASGERFTATGQIPWDEAGEMTLQLKATKLALETLLPVVHSLIPDDLQPTVQPVVEQLRGTLSADVALHVARDQWQKLASWSGEGRLDLRSIAALDYTLEYASGQWQFREGILDLVDLHSEWQNVPITGSARLTAAMPYSFQLEAKLPETDGPQLLAAAGVETPVDWNGQLSLVGEVTGELAPLRWQAAGSGTARDLRVGSLSLDDIPFTLSADEQMGRATAEAIPLAGGTADVSAQVPLTEDRPSQVTLQLWDLDAGQLVEFLQPLDELPRGRVSGNLLLTGMEQPARFSARGTFSSASAEFGPLPIEQASAELTVQQGEATLRADGQALGGRWNLAGSSPLPLDVPDPWERIHFQGSLTLEDADLAQAAGRLERREAEQLRELSGKFGGQWEIAWRPADPFPEVQGRAALRDLRWGRDTVLQSAAAELRLAQGVGEVRNIQAQLGRGRIGGQLRFPLSGTGAGSFHLTVTRCDVRRLLAPWPDVASQLEGDVDARIQGDLFDRWRGSAELQFSQARLAGLNLRNLRLPLEWSYSPARNVAIVRMRETTLRIAQGRAAVRGELRWDRHLDLQAAARLSGLDLPSLLRGRAALAGIPSGRLHGRLELSGTRVRSARDLRGSFSGTLENAQALRLPVLDSLVPILGSGQVGTAAFDTGDIQLSLARGRVEVERLAMASSTIQLLVTGQATLEGRLDLDVTAHLGQLDTRSPLARVLRASVLAAASPAQLALVVEASEWLSNRLIFAHVGGTVRSPMVRLRPAATLGREAIRFFLEEATGARTGGSGALGR
jgi:hypothetical protein